jgi:hypothetical protein
VALTEPMGVPSANRRAASPALIPLPPGFLMIGWSTLVGRTPTGTWALNCMLFRFIEPDCWLSSFKLDAAEPGSPVVPVTNSADLGAAPPNWPGALYGLLGWPLLGRPGLLAIIGSP